jgi:tetratricopeptide (TPR) repeat protein
MPGTTMGKNAKYKPEDVKVNLLSQVAERLQAKLGREVKLEIEMDKKQTGVIPASMFAEARDTDVYIADLTGANPNVYLELGVRWALRDNVTVLISQSKEDIKFNVSANRVIFYTPETLIRATEDIVSTILDGLSNNRLDSLVRLHSDLVTIPRKVLDELQAEIGRLTKSRGEDLLRAAKTTEDLTRRISLLKQVIDANPSATEAWLELGKALRSGGSYPDAVDALQTAKRLASDSAVVYRELGVCYSKMKKSELAANSLREAVRLDPKDAEAWSNLGGALRRLGMQNAPRTYDRKSLEEAYDSYESAHSINRYDLYAGLNVARLDALLSRWEPLRLDRAKEKFRKQISLCRYAVDDNPKDYWRRFDLADALLFSGGYEESNKVLGNAINIIPEDERRDTVSTVLGPMQDYLNADVLDNILRVEIEKAVKMLEAAKGVTLNP